MYLEPSRTSRVERFCENSQRLVVVNYFLQKCSIVDGQLGSKCTFGNITRKHKNSIKGVSIKKLIYYFVIWSLTRVLI